MNKDGVFAVICCVCLLILFFGGSSKPKGMPDIPTGGLIEAVASVKKSMTNDHIVDANKKVDSPQPSPSDRHEKAKREIVIFTRPNCPPCDRWKRCEQSKFEAEGWTVAYCDQHDYPLTPTFLIDAANKQMEHRGYLPFEKLKEVLK